MKKKIINLVVLAITIISFGFNIYFAKQNVIIDEYERDLEGCSLELEGALTSSQNALVELDSAFEEINRVTTELNTCQTQLKN